MKVFAMNSRIHEFQLSAEEFAYLKRLSPQNDALAEMLNSTKHLPGNKLVIQINHEAAEQLRAYFTKQLAIVGFDEQYEPTTEGQMLEDLIDRFYF